MIDDIGGICLDVPVKVDAGVLFDTERPLWNQATNA